MNSTQNGLMPEEFAELEALLESITPPLEPLDTSMLDGYLCGVLLQPSPVPVTQWFKHVGDVDGRALPTRFDAERLRHLVLRRHAELDEAIAGRQWFDPWVYELDEDTDPLEVLLPWVAGFATAMGLFPALTRLDASETAEPLATLYRVFDPEDLEDADDLLTLMEELEPPVDLEAAVESIVTSVLLLADVSRPQPAGGARPSRGKSPAGRQGRAGQPGAAGRMGGARTQPPAAGSRTPSSAPPGTPLGSRGVSGSDQKSGGRAGPGPGPRSRGGRRGP